MTAPATFNTSNHIIVNAMENAGLLQDGDTPSSEQYAKYLMKLNALINLWQTQGLKLWLWSDQAVTLVAGTATYDLYPSGSPAITKPLRVIEAYFLNTQSVSTPLTVMSWDDWIKLSNRTVQGALNSYFVNKLFDRLEVGFYLIPDTTAATGTAHLVLETQQSTPVGLTDVLAFPIEWFIALEWGLADEICTGQPVSIMARCKERAGMYRTLLEDWDVEDAPTSFTPDAQMSMGQTFNR